MRRSHLRMHLHDCRADSALGVQAAVGARVTIIRACWRLHVLISPAQICRRGLFGRFYACGIAMGRNPLAGPPIRDPGIIDADDLGAGAS